MGSSRLRKWLPVAALLASTAVGPASAQEVCVVLKDATGTLIEITNLGTLRTFLSHRIPLLNSPFSGAAHQGFALCANGEVVAAAVTGELGEVLTFGVAPEAEAQCVGPYTVEREGFNSQVEFLAPDGGVGNTYTVPVGTEVVVRTLTRGDAGLGVESSFTFTGGTAEIGVTRRLFTTGRPIRLTQIKEIADFDVSDQIGSSSRSVFENTSFGPKKEKLAVKLVDARSFGGAVCFRGTGNLQGATGRKYPTQAYAFDAADLEQEVLSCVPSSSATRELATGNRVAALFLNFVDDNGAGGVPLKGAGQPGSEYAYAFRIDAD